MKPNALAFATFAIALALLVSGCATTPPEQQPAPGVSSSNGTQKNQYVCPNGWIVSDPSKCETAGTGNGQNGTVSGNQTAGAHNATAPQKCVPNTVQGCNSTHYCAETFTCVPMESVSIVIYGEQPKMYQYYKDAGYSGEFQITSSGSSHPATVRLIPPRGITITPKTEFQIYPNEVYNITYNFDVPDDTAVGTVDYSIGIYQTVPGARVAYYKIYVERHF